MTDSERFARAIAAIDAGNADDPERRDRPRADRPEGDPARRARDRVGRAAAARRERAAAARRARSSLPPLDRAARRRHPAGRAGYLRWRKSLQAATRARARRAARPPRATTPTPSRACRRSCARTGSPHDAEVQVLEDALCLVFLETQLADVVARLDPDTLAARARAHRAEDERRRAAPRSPTCRSTRARAAILDDRARPRRRGALPRRSRRARLGRRRRDARTRRRAHGPVPRRRTAAASRTRRSWPRRSARSAATSSTSTACSSTGPVVTVELRETVDDGDARLETSRGRGVRHRRRPHHPRRGVPADLGAPPARAAAE